MNLYLTPFQLVSISSLNISPLFYGSINPTSYPAFPIPFFLLKFEPKPRLKLPMATPKYTVRPSTFSDLPTIAAIHGAAFSDNPNLKYKYPSCDPADLVAWHLILFEKDFHLPGKRYFVLEDESG
jgi:hypothetical protein